MSEPAVSKANNVRDEHCPVPRPIIESSDDFFRLNEDEKIQLRLTFAFASLVYMLVVAAMMPIGWMTARYLMTGSWDEAKSGLHDGAAWIPTILAGLLPAIFIAAIVAPLVGFGLGATFVAFGWQSDLVRFGGYVAGTTAFLPTSLIATAWYPDLANVTWDGSLGFFTAIVLGPLLGTVVAQLVLVASRWPADGDLPPAAFPRFSLAHLMWGTLGIGYILGLSKLSGDLSPVFLAIVTLWVPTQWCTMEGVVWFCRWLRRRGLGRGEGVGGGMRG